MEFNSCLAQCYLDDMHSMGSEFTWSNKQDVTTRTWARLDRVLVNPDWLALFPSSFATSLPPGISDHSPLLVFVAPPRHIQRRFSFLNVWQGHSDYEGLILHKNHFANISARVLAVKKELDACQNALQADLFSASLIEQERILTAKYAALSKLEVDLLFQRAKAHNIRKGDCSFNFFFSKIALRQHHSSIDLIQDKDGVMRYGIDAINTAFVEYYTSLLGVTTEVVPISESLFASGPRISDDVSAQLTLHVTRTEFKQALFSIPSNKSPGQDGFSTGFFKHSWATVGDSLCLAVEEYFKTGKMKRRVNVTLLALIPKKEWGFIKQMLYGLGFPSKFVQWTMGCIASTWFSLKINGNICGFFPESFDQFASISGLYANPSKTSIYYGGVTDDIKQQIEAATGYSEAKFPFRYLGVTLNPGRLAPDMFRGMMDKIQAAIHR
ncbi:uncharacterized protein LOC141649609 [Silene latifolia]|uniref:uncharacterized protein LOC141649609 n=1 Tax=Silene latifolia TaxID=37657 RepID=UPI003D776D51